jgi:pimeloyl-ACP methyl ester carboxylesterase
MKAIGQRHAVDHGGNGEVVVLLHGFAASSGYWKKLQPLLTRMGYRVITIDLLGFGRAPKPESSKYTYADHVEHIRNTLEQFHISKPVIMIGHSMGALLAARYSRLHVAGVKSLVLLHPPLYKNMTQARETLRNTGAFYRALLDSRMRPYLWTALRSVGIASKHNRSSREHSLTNIIESAELLDDLESLRRKTLLFVGARDRKVYLENLRERFVHQINPFVQVMVADVGHHSPRLRPKFVSGQIAAFLLPSKAYTVSNK